MNVTLAYTTSPVLQNTVKLWKWTNVLALQPRLPCQSVRLFGSNKLTGFSSSETARQHSHTRPEPDCQYGYRVGRSSNWKDVFLRSVERRSAGYRCCDWPLCGKHHQECGRQFEVSWSCFWIRPRGTQRRGVHD